MVGGFERDQPTGLGGQPLLQAAVPGLTDAFIHNRIGHEHFDFLLHRNDGKIKALHASGE